MKPLSVYLKLNLVVLGVALYWQGLCHLLGELSVAAAKLRTRSLTHLRSRLRRQVVMPTQSLPATAQRVVQAVVMKAEIKKVALEQGLVFGWASVVTDATGNLVVDHHGDMIPVSELENAAYGYVLNSRRGDEMHGKRHVARLVESFMVTPEKRLALGLGEGPSGWWVGFKIDDPEAMAKVKAGAYLDFSIGGRAKAVE
jgi:hypothetical protein